jgi:membrane-bound inhibitor of C-type lysozyme
LRVTDERAGRVISARQTAFAALLAVTLLAGCSPSAPAADNQDEAASPDAEDNSEDAAADAAVAPPVRYSCEDGRGVVARYANTGAVNATVDLDIAGVKRQLAQGISASGARYETPQGLAAGKTLAWWIKGDNATLIESDAQDAEGASDKIVNCDRTAATE